MNRSSAGIDYSVVLGAPRSGTTFLMDFIDTMPRTEAVSGNLLPTVIPHLINQDISPQVHDALGYAFRRALDDYLESGLFNSRSAALRKAIVIRRPELNPARRGRALQRIVYKEPFLAFAPQYTYDALPDSKIVYIVRDGRDVANSLVRSYDVLSDEKLETRTTEAPLLRSFQGRSVPWWVQVGREDEFLAATPFVRSTWMWAAMVGRCRSFFARPEVVGSGRVLEIPYEALIADPRTWGQRISDHLGVTMTARMRGQVGSARDSSIGTHRLRDPAEVAEAERVAFDELRAYGYL